jgi:hypothetical protein
MDVLHYSIKNPRLTVPKHTRTRQFVESTRYALSTLTLTFAMKINGLQRDQNAS